MYLLLVETKIKNTPSPKLTKEYKLKRYLLISCLLAGCATQPPQHAPPDPEAPTQTLTLSGKKLIPISQEEISKKRKVGSMAARIWFAFQGVKQPFNFILNNIDAPYPSHENTYADIFQALQEKKHHIVEKTDNQLVIRRDSDYAKIPVTVVYHFKEGFFERFEIQ